MHFATLLATVLYVLATPVPDPDPDPRGKRSPTSTVFPTPPPTFYPVSASAPTYTSSYVPTPPSPPGGHPVWYGGIPSTEIWIYGPKYLPMWFTCVGAKRVRKNSGVQISDCDGSPAQNWAMDGGINFWTNLRIADTQWCLDAGEHPRAGSTPKLKCCSGEASQRWWYRYTKFILSEPGPNNEYLCLDIKDGGRDNGTPLQIYPCLDENPNQMFFPGLCNNYTCYPP